MTTLMDRYDRDGYIVVKDLPSPAGDNRDPGKTVF